MSEFRLLTDAFSVHYDEVFRALQERFLHTRIGAFDVHHTNENVQSDYSHCHVYPTSLHVHEAV